MSEASLPQKPDPPKRMIWKVLGALFCVALLAFLFVSFDWKIAWQSVLGIGPIALLILVPTLCGLTLDSWSFQYLLRRFSYSPGVLQLLPIRFVAEAFLFSAPSGTVFSEGIKPALFHRIFGIPIPVGATVIIAHRYLMFWANGAYVLLGCAIGAAALMQLPWLVSVSAVAIAVGLMSLYWIAPPMLYKARMANWVRKQVERIPGVDLHALSEGDVDPYEETDRLTCQMFKDSAQWRLVSGLRVLSAWLCESVETWLILTLLGADVSLPEALVIETVGSLIRTMGLFAPGSLGVMDLSYIAILTSMGMANTETLAPAFVLVKRFKELVVVMVGYSLLGVLWRSSGPKTNTDANQVST